MADIALDEPDYSNISKWKVSELKRELANLGLPTKGKKEELVARLEKQLQDQEALDKDAEDVDINLDDGADEAEDKTAEITEIIEEENGAPDSPTETEDGEASVEITAVKEPAPSSNEVEEVLVKAARSQLRTQADTTASKTVPMTDAEAKLERARRFGIKSDDTKKLERAQRFGLPPTDEDKKALRAARFGIPSDTSTKSVSPNTQASGSSIPTDLEKMKKRAERFGGVVSSPALQKTVNTEALKRRRERFGSTDSEEAKRLKRAERFGL